MTHLPHGGDWAGFAARFGHPPLDFSANVSPLGVPDGVRAAIAHAAGDSDRYPDPLCRELTDAIARTEGIPASHILCGNGAADLIFRLVLALRPKRALLPAPAFSEYASALDLVGCQITHFLLREEDDFVPGDDFLRAIVPGTDIVFLCQPNNPTGLAVSPDYLKAVLAQCEAVGAVLALDACFADFLPPDYTLPEDIPAHPNLVVLKAFTKFYAMAGVRLGYCLCGDPALPDRMRQAGPPWSVSNLAQAAGLAALRETGYAQTVHALIARERPRLTQGLARLGFRVLPGQANFLLFQSPVPLLPPLAQRGILLRGCGNYRGLDDTWYRTAVRTEKENDQLLQALEEVLSSCQMPNPL